MKCVTRNLVLNRLYVLAAVLLTAVPRHFYLDASTLGLGGILSGYPIFQSPLPIRPLAGPVAGILLGLIATHVPLEAGFRAFRRLDFRRRACRCVAPPGPNASGQYASVCATDAR